MVFPAGWSDNNINNLRCGGKNIYSIDFPARDSILVHGWW
jgi:hypothetical protein